MDITSLLYDILKLVIAGVILLFVAYYMFKGFFENYKYTSLLGYKSNINKEVLPLKLQALERMTLFIERINPTNLMMRLHTTGQSAGELQMRALEEIREEYQHNVTQQLYLSTDTWSIIKRVKEDTIMLINTSKNELPADASAVALSKVVFAKLSALESDPYELALMTVRSQLQNL
ncbi:hypothetical protein [Pseudopedobacter beijingensis]|uniref:Uncharacterized protein n=1 Tax=Pseudopedobacter beijingensis TaxID=1207056 RepID=A0ABW4I9L3_9SPHI